MNQAVRRRWASPRNCGFFCAKSNQSDLETGSWGWLQSGLIWVRCGACDMFCDSFFCHRRTPIDQMTLTLCDTLNSKPSCPPSGSRVVLSDCCQSVEERQRAHDQQAQCRRSHRYLAGGSCWNARTRRRKSGAPTETPLHLSQDKWPVKSGSSSS